MNLHIVRLLVLVLYLTTTAVTGYSQTTRVQLLADSVAAMPETEVVVHIRVNNFRNIITAQGTLTFDTAVTELLVIEQFGLPDMDASNFYLGQKEKGKILFSWDDHSLKGQAIVDSTILFAVRFKVVGEYGESSIVSFTSNPTVLEFVDNTYSKVELSTLPGKVQVPFYSIKTSPLYTSSFCAGSSVSVAFDTVGDYYTDNTFKVELSDDKGSFADAIEIGTGNMSPIIATLPTEITEGSGYRLRVVANGPVVTGTDNGVNLSISYMPNEPIVTGSSSCGPGSMMLRANGAPVGGSYRWYATADSDEALATDSRDTFTTPELTESTTYYVATVNSLGCESKRVPVEALVLDLEQVIAGLNQETCIDNAAFILEGAEPTGGVWSGKGVSAAGKFNPSEAGAGVHELTYTITCQNGSIATAMKEIRVIDVTKKPNITQIGVDSLVTDVIGARYEWEANGQAFSSTTNRIKIAEPGFYKVRVLDGKCISELSDTFAAPFYSDYKIFPNPSQGLMTISGPTFNDYLEINVIDALGKQIFSKTLSSFTGQEQVDLRPLKAGLYFMVLRTAKVKKVIKLTSTN